MDLRVMQSSVCYVLEQEQNKNNNKQKKKLTKVYLNKNLYCVPNKRLHKHCNMRIYLVTLHFNLLLNILKLLNRHQNKCSHFEPKICNTYSTFLAHS